MIKRLTILFGIGAVFFAGCAQNVRQVPRLDDFSIVRVSGDSATFVSAPNRLVPVRDRSDPADGVKTLHEGGSMRLQDEHGAIIYEVLRVAPDQVVVKQTAEFYHLDDNRMHRETKTYSVKPYEQ